MCESDSSIDSWLDPSLDDGESNDSWLAGGSDTENYYEYQPIQVPSPVKKGNDPRNKSNAPKKGAGRRPLTEKFPQILNIAEEFVTQNSYAADSRRRSIVGRACGTSIPTLKRHLEQEVPDLSISKATCSRLMVAPNKHRRASSKYTGLIQAKVPAKRNDERAFHEDSHYCSARVKYRLEFAAEYSSEVVALSCDCMNKVHIGGLAVSRYHQLQRFHMLNDSPNYPDHDFPSGSGYLITPCGYMELTTRKDPSSNEYVSDELDRQHIPTPRTGTIHIVNRSQKFHKMTIQEHVNDLIPILENCTNRGQTGVVLVVDGGPDWSEASWTVLVYLSRLFQRVNLDFLSVTKYAPKNSALNPIEHGWAPLSRMLTSVRLSSTLDGEAVPPSLQTGLTSEERQAKEARLFDEAMEQVDSFWNGQKYDSHPINSHHHPCQSPSEPYGDYERVHSIVSGSKTKLLENPDLHAEIMFALKHVYRRPRDLCFVKCTDSDCTFCSTHPVRALTAMSQIRQGRGPLLVPTETTGDPTGHFRTYLDASRAPEVETREKMPSFLKKDLGQCPFCRCYAFSSKEDKKRHLNIFHT